MRAYEEHLELCAPKDPKDREDLTKKYCRGWFCGSAADKKDLLKDLVLQNQDVVWGGRDYNDLKEARWNQIVGQELSRLKKKEIDLSNSRKGAKWKVEIAIRLRKETIASNPWIANRLHMGHPNYVSNLIINSKS